jgi:hypothetical protein
MGLFYKRIMSFILVSFNLSYDFIFNEIFYNLLNIQIFAPIYHMFCVSQS